MHLGEEPGMTAVAAAQKACCHNSVGRDNLPMAQIRYIDWSFVIHCIDSIAVDHLAGAAIDLLCL